MTKRILFDPNVPRPLRQPLEALGHRVDTAQERKWHQGYENGELIRMAEQDGCDIIITFDNDYLYLWDQGHPPAGRLACVHLSGRENRAVDHLDDIAAAVESSTHGELRQVAWSLDRR